MSKACTSTGWVTTFYMEHSWMLAQFPQEAQEAIFGKQPYILAPASISPNGKAVPDKDGFRISGRWPWGTGVMHADWVLLNGMVEGDGFEPRLFIVPREQVTVEDTWYCAGMEGTGSNDMLAEDLYVPSSRSESLMAMSLGRGSGALWHDSPCYSHPMLPLLSIAAAVSAVGAARKALDLFEDRLGGRALYGTLTRQAERPGAQVLLGNSTVRVDSAEKMIRDVVASITHWGTVKDICPPEERVRRDINTLSCHTVFDREIAAENYGRLLLGMDPASPV